MKLYNGDALDILKKTPSDSIDLILCDLPYGTTQNSWDKVIDLNLMFQEAMRVIKPHGVVVFFASMPFTAKLYAAGETYYKYNYVWNKNKSSGHLNAKKRPLRQHEDILVFAKENPVYYVQKTQGHKPLNYAVNEIKSTKGKFSSNYGKVKPTISQAGTTERYPSSVLNFKVLNNDDSKRIHPTQKPEELLEFLIKTYTKEKEVVLDFCMGSGSTGVTALKLNRDFIGVEKDKNYFKKAKKWLQSIKK